MGCGLLVFCGLWAWWCWVVGSNNGCGGCGWTSWGRAFTMKVGMVGSDFRRWVQRVSLFVGCCVCGFLFGVCWNPMAELIF